MNIETLRLYCLSKKEVTESMPFGEDTLVFKVCNKMFALTNLESPLRVNLKCDPALALSLRERYAAVLPGYHMNKQHWNTVVVDETISEMLLKTWIDHSYSLVVQSLPRAIQLQLEAL